MKRTSIKSYSGNSFVYLQSYGIVSRTQINYYVFDIKYPRHNKPILEVFDYIVLHETGTDKIMKPALLKKLTIAAQSVITEYEKKLLT